VLRFLVAFVLSAVVATGCSDSPSDAAPDLDAGTVATLSVAAIQNACPACSGSEYLYVQRPAVRHDDPCWRRIGHAFDGSVRDSGRLPVRHVRVPG